MKPKNKDIPIEAVLKYIVKERDRYKEKLSQLIPYAKSLEKHVMAYERASKEEKVSFVSKIASLEGENKRLTAEIKDLRTDYKSSEWYQTLRRSNKELREKNKELKNIINRLLCERAMKEHGDN